MNTVKPIKLALDANGGDFGPEITVAAACDAVIARKDIEIILVAREQIQPGCFSRLDEAQKARIRREPAALVLESGVSPIAAMRYGSQSSMGRALELVANGDADACVSAGSTTALMALGIRLIGMVRGLKRPALMGRIPSASGYTSLLDLGANLHVDALRLMQFAIMGAVARGHGDHLSTRVGLLNVGHEDSKGHAVVKEAHDRLKQLPLNYQGFIEGNDIFSGKVDVAVCDGFSGNLVLKSGEGLANMLLAEIGKGFNTDFRSKLGAMLAGPAMRKSLARFEPAQHNGAPLLGLNGVVVKSHGAANREATLQAIFEAVDEAGQQVPGQIETLIAEYEAGTGT